MSDFSRSLHVFAARMERRSRWVSTAGCGSEVEREDPADE
jgi:hypothetical protein